jgi:predicted amidophosphoribosyltransferase
LIQQKGLGKTERRLNLKGNIAYIGKKPLSEPIVLVDDLMTTGATLDSCAAVLKGAQSPAVFGMTLFYD